MADWPEIERWIDEELLAEDAPVGRASEDKTGGEDNGHSGEG